MKSLVGPITGLICSLFILAPLSITSVSAAEVKVTYGKSFRLKCSSDDQKTTIRASLDGRYASTDIGGKLAIYESTYHSFQYELNLDLNSLDEKPLLSLSIANIRTLKVPLNIVSKGTAVRYKPGSLGKVEYQFMADIGAVVTGDPSDNQNRQEVFCRLYR